MCCVPVWWNWQTRGTQNPVMATSCGFDPHHRHQNLRAPRTMVSFSGLFYAFSVLFLCENPVLNNEKRAIIDKKRKSHDLKVGKRRKSIILFLIFFGACGTICVYTTAAPRNRRTKKCRRTNQTKEGNGLWINWC